MVKKHKDRPDSGSANCKDSKVYTDTFEVTEENGGDIQMPMLKTVLIVEDNEINRGVLHNLLASAYQVLEADNGQAALEVLQSRHEEISLILLDINMPVMDGYTFLSHIKANSSFSSIPVIVTTQSDSEADEVSALSHGASDFVPKPYKARIILHRVASIIRLRETAAMINQFQYDRLTGLYSKEYFYQRVREIFQQYPERQFDLIASDIENFKLINDILGVAAGDRLLQGIAGQYRQMVGDKGICGRLNADQFVCLLENNKVYTADMFASTLEQVNALPNAQNVVMKWGIYYVEDRTLPVEQMCDRALLAARSIKGQYGKHFAAYDDKLRGELLRQQAIIDGMETALSEGQFMLYLQPKYRIRDNKLVGAEALIRWNHPIWGFQLPAEFIPLFEKNGFIAKLDQFVWDKACSTLREWDEKGYLPISISVNVSRADIYNINIIEILMDTVRRHGLRPSRLHLEITESAYTEQPAQIIETITKLRELGFIIEMDDFGSGYSSLNMLNQMPLDILKLDMKFIQGETGKSVGQGILQTIVELARRMRLSVVAEGVETKEQLDRVAETGCDYVQGYYFAKPMPIQDLEALLKERRAAELLVEDNDCIAAPHFGMRLRPLRQLLLIADVDQEYRKEVEKTFSRHFQVIHSTEADSTLTFVTQYKDQLAAVLISKSLPGLDGFTVFEMLKDELEVWNIPVLVTGAQDSEAEERALELGAFDYADKPHTAKSLLKRTLKAIRLSSFQEREHALQNEANRDHMTGFLNRRGLEAAIHTMGKEDTPFAFCLFDLDDLKKTNDTLGYTEGDRIIQEITRLIRAQSRKSDILARYGGDEFIVILKQIQSADVVVKRVEGICRALKKNTFEQDIQASASAGIVISENLENGMDEVFRQADMALYRAKTNHKGSSCLWRNEDESLQGFKENARE
ncbi:EAL domain-containing protein [Lactonifactor longoviformis]|uniref:Stage 0 sporulation protein A homolog n=1 Tax=Lactonifactor longoviformis DSM 17459 TaxID=1122155 RepID=A0A1M4WYD2_9CLOT|nr:diguanylate cyclase (GGDEF) domain-containing protein [Lactonifactor longoviformis DSM 17459]